MAKAKFSQNAEDKIAKLYEELNLDIAELARNKIMQAFRVGSSTLDGIRHNVSGLTERSTKLTHDLNATFLGAGVTSEKTPSRVPILPVATPSTPEVTPASTTPGSRSSGRNT